MPAKNTPTKRAPAKAKPATDPTASHHAHPNHADELRRLSRIIGQLEGIRRMIEERRYCRDILTQTQAAKAAIRGLESSILSSHINHCVRSAASARNPQELDDKIRELVELFERRS